MGTAAEGREDLPFIHNLRNKIKTKNHYKTQC